MVPHLLSAPLQAPLKVLTSAISWCICGILLAAGKTTRRRKSEQRKSRRSSAHPEDVRQLEEMNRTLRSELHLSGKNVAMVSVRLQSSQQRLAVVLNKLEQLEDYDTYPTQQISDIYDGPAAAEDDQLPRMTIAPTDLKETVKVTLRGLGKVMLLFWA